MSVLSDLLSLRRTHYVCDDCWYSCPASGECCNDELKLTAECDCGADTHNATLDRVILALREREVIE